MEQSPNQPVMTTMAGRPIKILHTPDASILVACRTAAGEDVHVPLMALLARMEQDIVSKLRGGGQTHGSNG
jgi:hypothetical protein